MNRADFILRDYQEADIPYLLDVIQQAFAQYQGQLQPPSSAEAIEDEKICLSSFLTITRTQFPI